MLFLLCCAFGWARPNSGSSLTSAGGGTASVMEMSVLGMSINPASAYTRRFQLKLDMALLSFRLNNYLEGPEQALVEERYGAVPEDWVPISGQVSMSGVSPAGSFGMSFPVGRFAIGLETFVPYGTGARLEEDGVQRFFTTGGYLLFGEQNVILTMPVSFKKHKFTLGGAFRAGMAGFSSNSATDTGLLLYQVTGEEEEDLILDPLFEGTKKIEATGMGFGYAFGMHWENPYFSTHLAYRSAVQVSMKGKYDLLLAKAFTLQLEADLDVDMTFPAEAYVGFVVPMRRFDLLLESGWAGWSVQRYLTGKASNLELKSEDAFFQSVLEDYGLTQNELLTSDQSFFRDSGTRDSIYGEVMIRVPWTDKLMTRSGVRHSTSTVPIKYGSMSNMDYNTTNIRGTFHWKAISKLSLIFSYDYMIRPKRTVKNSIYSIYNDSVGGLNGLNGNGEFSLQLRRFGLTMHLHL